MIIFTLFAMIVFIIFQVLYIFVPIFSTKRKKLNGTEGKKNISVLIPAYNEELTVSNCVNSLKNVEYEKLEGIIINDGSKDNTMGVLASSLDLEKVTYRKFGKELEYKRIKAVYKSRKYKNIFVIDKENGGKADALNAGIDFAFGEIVITLDADSMLEKDSLKYIDKYFEDEDIVASGGTVFIVQGTKKEDGKIVPKFKGTGIIKHQIFHYIHSFYIKKQTQSVFNSIVVISGAFGAFKKEILTAVGGFRCTVGEDIDITLKIYKYIKENKLKKKLVYSPEAVCYTECPDSTKMYFKQRYRWQKAFIDCIVEYWGELFVNFSTGLSLFFAVDGFILGTISAFATIYLFLVLLITKEGILMALLFIALSLVVDVVQTIISFAIAQKYGYGYSFLDWIKIILFIPIDKIIYKFLPMYVNIVGSIKYFFDDEQWGTIERKGEITIM